MRLIGWGFSIVVFSICIAMLWRLNSIDLLSQVWSDVRLKMPEDRANELSPNISAEFFAFWFALAASILTAFITAKIATETDQKKVRTAYLSSLKNGFAKLLVHIVGVFEAVRKKLPESVQSEYFKTEDEVNSVSEALSELISENDAMSAAPALNFDEFRTVLLSSIRIEAQFGIPSFWMRDLLRIEKLLPIEESRNLFIRNFVKNFHSAEEDSVARGKLGLSRVQKEPHDIVDAMKGIRKIIARLSKYLGEKVRDDDFLIDDLLSRLEVNRNCILNYIHSTEKKYTYKPSETNDVITKLES